MRYSDYLDALHFEPGGPHAHPVTLPNRAWAAAAAEKQRLNRA
jgi:hypothetical protein